MAFAGHVGFYVAGTAVDLGLPLRTVFALVAEVSAGLDDVAWEHMTRFGAGVSARHLVSECKALTINWADLADRADEPFDVAAWRAHHADVHDRLYPEIEFDTDEANAAA